MQDFKHIHSAHCESGVTSLLLKHNGLDISEPMAFGLGSGLTFAYLPIVKLSGMPLIAYRSMPKAIIKKATKRLGIKLQSQTFSNQQKAQDSLDRLLDEGRFVGLQTSVFYLPYFPDNMRFHFNAHNLIVYGKEGDEYLVSDPVFEYTVKIHQKDLLKARFAKGALAPKGLLYYIDSKPKEIDYPKIIKSSIKSTIKEMNAPLFFVGIRGIRYLAKQIKNIPKKYKNDLRYPRLYLGHIVRMQEEIGTGGAGFRYMFASFLQESSSYTNEQILQEASKMMTEVGDEWRVFAQSTALMCKNRKDFDFDGLADMLNKIVTNEAEVYKKLKQIK
ncbi:MAG: BtrH N-terminal domain-containing protein [Epsilonproteobacteria bacterium]|nr:BtrH N-terminal domain-containing protein [Campylobacterota bacterium]